jgi:hypothetical protein
MATSLRRRMEKPDYSSMARAQGLFLRLKARALFEVGWSQAPLAQDGVRFTMAVQGDQGGIKAVDYSLLHILLRQADVVLRHVLRAGIAQIGQPQLLDQMIADVFVGIDGIHAPQRQFAEAQNSD